MARGIHPYRKNRKDVFGWVVSVSREVQRDVAQKKILSYLNPSWIEDITMISGSRGSPEYGIIDQIRIKNVFGGISVIGFKSCDLNWYLKAATRAEKNFRAALSISCGSTKNRPKIFITSAA